MVLTSSFLLLPVILAGFLPYLLVFVPQFLQQSKLRSEQTVRRERFQKETATGEAFHNCEVCSATDITHPERDFRITADDREICSVCLDLERATMPGKASENS